MHIVYQMKGIQFIVDTWFCRGRRSVVRSRVKVKLNLRFKFISAIEGVI